MHLFPHPQISQQRYTYVRVLPQLVDKPHWELQLSKDHMSMLEAPLTAPRASGLGISLNYQNITVITLLCHPTPHHHLLPKMWVHYEVKNRGVWETSVSHPGSDSGIGSPGFNVSHILMLIKKDRTQAWMEPSSTTICMSHRSTVLTNSVWH